MTGDDDRDVAARLAELEATVRGLTQELVSAEDRIRQLEAALEDAADGPATDGGPTKATREEAETGSSSPPADATEEGRDPDDIIVA